MNKDQFLEESKDYFNGALSMIDEDLLNGSAN